MGKQTSISWTDATYNPWIGCKKISEGCRNCYMFREQIRYGKDPNQIVRTRPANFNMPLHWHEPIRVFTCSWSDFFIEQADPWRAEAWDIIRRTPHLTYQILTKRPERITECLPPDWGDGYPNVWLGVTVESSAYLWRAEILSRIPARLRFISYEPALGLVDSFSLYLENIKLLISGGESGPGYRWANPFWFDSARRQCEQYGVAYFHKQNGGNKKVGGVWGGDLLNGKQYHEFPQVMK